jgi:hypothetical protein
MLEMRSLVVPFIIERGRIVGRCAGMIGGGLNPSNSQLAANLAGNFFGGTGSFPALIDFTELIDQTEKVTSTFSRMRPNQPLPKLEKINGLHGLRVNVLAPAVASCAKLHRCQ